MISVGLTVYYLALSTEKMEAGAVSANHFKKIVNPLVLMQLKSLYYYTHQTLLIVVQLILEKLPDEFSTNVRAFHPRFGHKL